MRPFIKWVGGKTQLLTELNNNSPFVDTSKKWTFVEPFGGGGAFMLDIIDNERPLNRVIYGDVNTYLCKIFHIIAGTQEEYDNLKKVVIHLHNTYNELSMDLRDCMYYALRELWNNTVVPGNSIKEWMSHDSKWDSYFPEDATEECMMLGMMMFFNKTCFNGLWRVNRRNELNMPHGHPTKAKIYDGDNLEELRSNLTSTEFKFNVYNGSYLDIYKEMNLENEKDVFFYLDPPYRPISQTSSFTSYTKDGWTDKEQKELKEFCDYINSKGHKFLLSNSYSEDGFFQELYKDYNIIEISGRRNINCKGDKRGLVKELLIRNF